jgi:hypothetical protein
VVHAPEAGPPAAGVLVSLPTRRVGFDGGGAAADVGADRMWVLRQ